MKTVILALLVLLVVCEGEALRCHCEGRRYCEGDVETCVGLTSACGSVTFFFPISSYSKGCMEMSDCHRMNQPGVSTATCCTTDLCNW
ncbi:short neurotoxin 3-like [Dunckerocampus dactyliophorus]|uniref:short neurotoxin 3-like n=1 Tax=Dunckerocampus dactyliophorus TaxID=161453 RepID=UPI0024074D70|nr:short neurotoxin 3-like [Dunckerocampus dactyliophorus]